MFFINIAWNVLPENATDEKLDKGKQISEIVKIIIFLANLLNIIEHL
jgi:hypothetical protein